MHAAKTAWQPRLDELVRTHQAELWRYLRFLGCTADEAADLAQDTFVAVLERPFEVRDARATAAYLRTVARRLLMKARRRSARRPNEHELVAAEAFWVAHADAGRDERRVLALRLCMAELDGRGRDALQRRYHDGASRDAIATALGMTRDGVKSLLRRCRDLLGRCIERRLTVEERA